MLTKMKFLGPLLTLLTVLTAGSCYGQTSVRQSGSVTPRHGAMWTTNGVIQDAGTAANGFLSSIGTQGNGPTICANSAPITGPYNQLCLGASTTGPAQITLQNYGGASAQSLEFIVNGSPITIPALPLFTIYYGTVAEAAGATISASTNVVITQNYRTGFAGGGATYYKSATVPAHNLYFQSQDGAYWALTPQQGTFTFKQAGAYGDASHDDVTALNNSAAFAASQRVTALCEGGTYNHSTTLNWSYSNLSIDSLAGDNKCVIKHTGTGLQVQIDAGASSGFIYNVTIGTNSKILFRGNTTSTTYNLYLRSVHHSNIRAAAADATAANFSWLFGVLNNADLTVSSNEVTINTKAAQAVLLSSRTSVEGFAFNGVLLTIEGQSTGLVLGYAVGNVFRGASEGNDTYGVFANNTAQANSFTGFDCEENLNFDYYLDGATFFTFNNSNGASTGTNNGVIITSNGYGHHFINGQFRNIRVEAGTKNNTFEGTGFLGTYADNGTETTEINMHFDDVSGAHYRPTKMGSVLQNTSGRILKSRTVTAAGTITVATTDHVICVNKTVGAASAVSLMATPTTGTTIIVKDCKGDANSNNITVTPAAGNIDGAGTAVITANYGKWWGVYTGTEWSTMALN